MDIHQDGRIIIRFSMFQAFWQNKQSAMARYFPQEPKHSPPTKWMTFGSMVAEALEQRPLPWWLTDVPPADISEYRIIEEFDGAWVRGTLDKFMWDGHTIIDNKSLKRKTTPKEEQILKSKLYYGLEDFSSLKAKFDEEDALKYKEQLMFYQVLVEQKHGSVNPMSYIEVIPVFEDNNGLIRRTGEASYMVPVPVSAEERAEMKAKIISTAKDIQTCWTSYVAGHIKL